MSFPVLTNSGGQIGTGLLYSNVVYFPNEPTNSGTRVVSWTIPTGVTTVRVRVWGGGGGGTNTGSSVGGGGGFAMKTITSLTPGTVTVTIGIGASGGTPATGGTSSFGSYVSATGGSNTTSTGGAGSGGDINMRGGASNNNNFGGNAGNLFIPFTGVASTEIFSISSFPALTLMGTPTNPLDKIGTGYLFGMPSKAIIGYNQNSLSILPNPDSGYFGNGAGGFGAGSASSGTYPGGGSSYYNGGSGLVIVEY